MHSSNILDSGIVILFLYHHKNHLMSTALLLFLSFVIEDFNFQFLEILKYISNVQIECFFSDDYHYILKKIVVDLLGKKKQKKRL